MYIIPINITKKNKETGNSWNYFENISNLQNGQKETFLYTDGMQKGDVVFLYLTNNGLKKSNYDKESGIYAIGKIVSDKQFILNDTSDFNYVQNKDTYVVEVEFSVCESEPIDLCKYIFPDNSSESKPFSIVNKLKKL